MWETDRQFSKIYTLDSALRKINEMYRIARGALPGIISKAMVRPESCLIISSSGDLLDCFLLLVLSRSSPNFWVMSCLSRKLVKLDYSLLRLYLFQAKSSLKIGNFYSKQIPILWHFLAEPQIASSNTESSQGRAESRVVFRPLGRPYSKHWPSLQYLEETQHVAQGNFMSFCDACDSEERKAHSFHWKWLQWHFPLQFPSKHIKSDKA